MVEHYAQLAARLDVSATDQAAAALQRAAAAPQRARTLRRTSRRLDLSQRKQAAVQRWAQRRFTPQWRTFRVSFSMMRFCFRSSRRICSTSPCVSRFLRCDCRAHDSVITVCVRVCSCTRARAARCVCDVHALHALLRAQSERTGRQLHLIGLCRKVEPSQGEPSPGADVGMGQPSPEADVGGEKWAGSA